MSVADWYWHCFDIICSFAALTETQTPTHIAIDWWQMTIDHKKKFAMYFGFVPRIEWKKENRKRKSYFTILGCVATILLRFHFSFRFCFISLLLSASLHPLFGTLILSQERQVFSVLGHLYFMVSHSLYTSIYTSTISKFYI